MLLEYDREEGASGPDVCGSTEDRLGRARLLARIKAAFPALIVHKSWVEQSGGDHVLLIVNDDLAFRFPRDGMHGLHFELEVLRAVRPRTSVAVPFYEYLDPAGRFAGYRFIDGLALTETRFAELSIAAGDRLVEDIAGFLAVLHHLSPEAIGWSGAWPTAWMAAQFADRGLADRLPLIARLASQLEKPAAAFWRRYRHDRPERAVIVHGDLVGDHILVDPIKAELSGIIDFGDAALGDPAQDFIGLWSYGRHAVERAIALYQRGAADPDPGLLGRSRNHFIRYRLDQLYERLSGDDREMVGPGEIRAVGALLAPSAHQNYQR